MSDLNTTDLAAQLDEVRKNVIKICEKEGWNPYKLTEEQLKVVCKGIFGDEDILTKR